MATFSVNDTLRRAILTGNGSTTSFAFSFQVNAITDIKVYVDGVLKTQGTGSANYAVQDGSGNAGLSNTGTGAVVFVTAPANATTVTILSDIPLARTSLYTSGGNVTASSLENDFDTLTMALGDREERDARSLQAPVQDPTSIDMTLPAKASRLGKILGFNETTGNPEISASLTAVQSLSDVTASINLLGTSAVVEDLGILATTAIVEDMALLGTSSNVSAMALLGVSSVITDMSILGTADIVEDMGFLGTSSNVTAMGHLGTSANVTAMGKLGNDATVADMALLGTDAVVADMAQLANSTIIDDLAILANSTITDDMAILATSANVTAMGVLGTSANVTAMGLLGTSAVVTDLGLLGTSANVTAMGNLGTSANVTAMGILGTSDVVADLALLGTSDVVADLALLATTSNINAMALLGTSSVVSNLALLGTTAVVEDLGLLATSTVIEDMGLLATSSNITNMATLGASGVVGNIATVAGANSNITALNASGVITNIGTVASNISTINSVASTVGGSQTFTITVASVGGSNVFVVDGSNNPTLSLVRGFTYIFDQSDSSNAGHPLAFKNGSSSYTTGVTVTGTAGQAGAKVTFVVASDAPASGLLYYCTSHGNAMGNTIATTQNDIATVVANLSGINSFASRYRVGSSNPSSDNDEGDLFFNTTSNALNYYDGSSFQAIVAGAMTSLAVDSSPQLGGDLDVQTNSIVSVSNRNIAITPNGSGKVVLDGLSYPSSDGSDGQFLKTDGSGVLSFATVDLSTLSPIAGSSSIVTTGALNSGSITSGFGTIDTGSSNITSTGVGAFGSLDISGDIDVDGTTNLDVVDIDGAVDMASTLTVNGETTLNSHINIPDSVELKFGADADFKISHNGSKTKLEDTGTGNLEIRGTNIEFYSGDGGETLAKLTDDGAVELYHNNSKKFETTSSGVTVTGTVTATSFSGDGSNLSGISSVGGSTGVDFNDNVKARFGTGNDLEIFHNGSDSFIQDEGTGNLKIRTNGTAIELKTTADEAMLVATKDGGVDLYHNNSNKFQTISGGVNISGDITATSDGGNTTTSIRSGSAKAWHRMGAGDGSITTRDSLNMSSIQDNGTGRYTFYINANMSNGNYSLVIGPSDWRTVGPTDGNESNVLSGSYYMTSRYPSNAGYLDSIIVSSAVNGSLA